MFDLLIVALTIGSAYALLAMGYSLIFASMRLLHLAQGDFLMLGGFIAFSIATGISSNALVTIIIAMILVALLGGVVERFCYRKIPYHLHGPRIIATLGVGLVIRNIASNVWGAEAETLPDGFFAGPTLKFGSMQIQPSYYWTLIIAPILMVLLYFFLNRTKAGLAIRASAHKAEVAELMGINVSRSRAFTFMIACALTACAGILVSPMTFIHYEMGLALGMKGFSAAVLGGLGNIPGAMIGGFLLGIIETFGATAINSGYKDCIAFIVLILILVFKPSGLFGVSEPEQI